MENKNSNKWLYLIIVILCILVLLLGGYIVYDKVLENTNENINSINQDNDNKYTNWMDYIMDTDISSIKLGFCVDAPSNEHGIPTKETIDITKNDLNKIFTEMKKGTISKNYYGGLGGPCMTSIDVNYTNNDKQYKLDLVLYKFIDPEFTDDQNILSYLEDASYTIKKYNDDIDLSVEPYMFEYTYNKDIIDAIIRQYTK